MCQNKMPSQYISEITGILLINEIAFQCIYLNKSTTKIANVIVKHLHNLTINSYTKDTTIAGYSKYLEWLNVLQYKKCLGEKVDY